MIHLAAHLELATNPIHNDLAGTALAHHFFVRGIEPFKPPGSNQSVLVVDLVRRYVHIHRDAVWRQPGLLDALPRNGFEVVWTRGRWRPVPYQNLWRAGQLARSYPRNPLAKVEHEQEPIEPIWTNPRYCRGTYLPYPAWPPRAATLEMLARIAQWTPQADVPWRYAPALARLNPDSDAYALGQVLASLEVDRLADWFEVFAPRCYADDDDPRNVLSTVLLLEAESPDGEALAGALIRLAAKMRSLGYALPGRD